MAKVHKPIEYTYEGKHYEFESAYACSKATGLAPSTILGVLKKEVSNDILMTELLNMKRFGRPCQHPGCELRTRPGKPRDYYCVEHAKLKYRAERNKLQYAAEKKRRSEFGLVSIHKSRTTKKKLKKKFIKDRHDGCFTCSRWIKVCSDKVCFGEGINADPKECGYVKDTSSSLKTNIPSGGQISTAYGAGKY